MNSESIKALLFLLTPVIAALLALVVFFIWLFTGKNSDLIDDFFEYMNEK